METALRVLVSWINGANPAPEDLEELRTAFPSSGHLPADELACQVIHDLNGTSPQTERRQQVKPLMEDVA